MYGIIFLFMAMFCHNPNHHTGKGHNSGTQVTTLDDEGAGGDSGDTGHVPPKPPTPPTNP